MLGEKADSPRIQTKMDKFLSAEIYLEGSVCDLNAGAAAPTGFLSWFPPQQLRLPPAQFVQPHPRSPASPLKTSGKHLSLQNLPLRCRCGSCVG